MTLNILIAPSGFKESLDACVGKVLGIERAIAAIEIRVGGSKAVTNQREDCNSPISLFKTELLLTNCVFVVINLIPSLRPSTSVT